VLHGNFQRPARALAVFALAAAVAACGGGGDTPQAPSSTQTLVSDGDTMPDGFVIENVESANLGNDGTVGFIASRSGPPNENAVYARQPNGNVVPLLTPSQPPPAGLSLSLVRNILVSGTGDVSFEIGTVLDDDAVFLYSGGQLTMVARTDPNATPPGFRILGERRIANGGQIAFSYGTSPCMVDQSGDRERVTCDLRVYYGDASLVTPLDLPADLENRTPTAVTVIMDDGGHLVLGLPASGRRSLVGTVSTDGTYSSILNRQDVIGSLGTLLSATPRAVNVHGSILVDARFDTNGDGVADKDWLLLIADGGIAPIAETGVPAGSKQVLQVRGNALDDSNGALFSVTFGDPGQSTGLLSLRYWRDGVTREVVFEGQPFGEDDEGNDLQILDVEDVRLGGNGDAIFHGVIGYFDEGTRTVTSTRIFRWNDGVGETLLETGEAIQSGTLVELNIQDVSDGGDVLLIAGVNTRPNRALLLLPRALN
jgi:hypothetical protein